MYNRKIQLRLWKLIPFTLTEKDGRLYGRGVADDMICHGTIGSSWRLPALHETLPVNVYFVGWRCWRVWSEHFKDYLRKVCLWIWKCRFSYLGIWYRPWWWFVWGTGVKAGLRSRFQHGRQRKIFIHRLQQAVDSAAWRLIDAIASLRGQDGEIQLMGFMIQLASRMNASKPSPGGKVTLESLKRLWVKTAADQEDDGWGFSWQFVLLSPTWNIEKVSKRYQVRQAKTVTPASATAKLEIRLGTGQELQDVFWQTSGQLKRNGSGDVEATLTLATPDTVQDMSALTEFCRWSHWLNSCTRLSKCHQHRLVPAQCTGRTNTLAHRLQQLS